MRPQKNRGGTLKETVLWTNPNPNANYGVNNVTLSQDINNFALLKFTYKAATNINTMAEVIINVDEFKASLNGGNTINVILGSRGSQVWARMIYYVSDTSIRIDQAHQVYGTSVNNGYSIPLEIIGLK